MSTETTGTRTRQARVSDHPAIIDRVQSWWGDTHSPEQSRELSLLLPKLFLQFFSETSLVVERAGRIDAFLIGLHSPDTAADGRRAYIHFVGVAPELRGQGVGRALYEEFCRRAAAAGCKDVRSVTSPRNTRSIAFHRAMGFGLEPGDREVDGLPVHGDYDGPGHDRVCFRREL
ncbi:GNAT family N-acetyltransferase [Streptomyces sp. NPDC093510]|uniref:GNAT family N-acetyltransferase n=1 Tax=Streptomyces sp. NPDC093510 TaxID=3155199 RepID=UPI0034409B6D